jgi:hypothetical protein
VNLARTRPSHYSKARIDPKNEAKKIKALDCFADFLKVIPCMRSKTQDRLRFLNIIRKTNEFIVSYLLNLYKTCPSNNAAPQANTTVIPFENHAKHSKAGIK